MKVTKRVEYRLNMGDYESLCVTGEAELDTETDYDDPPTDPEVLADLTALIEAAVAPELDKATPLAIATSFLHTYRN